MNLRSTTNPTGVFLPTESFGGAATLQPAQKKFIKWYLTKTCDLGCSFCHNSDTRNAWSGDASLSDYLAIAYKLRNSSRVAGLSFLGGEPTLLPAMPEICRRLVGADFKFGIVTAGHHLHRPDFHDLPDNPNLGFLGFSIDSLDPVMVQTIRKRDVLDTQLSNLKATLQRRASSGLRYDVYVNTVLTRANFAQMVDILETFCEWGVNKVKILAYNMRDRGAKGADTLRLGLDEEYHQVHSVLDRIRDLQPRWEEAKFEVEYNFLPAAAKQFFFDTHGIDFGVAGHMCPISRDVVFMQNDGRVFACEDFKPRFGTTKPVLVAFGIPGTSSGLTDTEENHILSLATSSVDEVFDASYLKSTFDVIADPSHYDNYEPCNECPHLLRTCVPCGIMATDKDTDFIIEKCDFYRIKAQRAGVHKTRVPGLAALRKPISKKALLALKRCSP